MQKLHKFYLPILEKALSFKKVIVLSLIGFLAVGAFLAYRLGGEFLPRLDEGSIAIQFIRPVWSGITHSVSLDAKSMEVILTFLISCADTFSPALRINSIKSTFAPNFAHFIHTNVRDRRSLASVKT